MFFTLRPPVLSVTTTGWVSSTTMAVISSAGSMGSAGWRVSRPLSRSCSTRWVLGASLAVRSQASAVRFPGSSMAAARNHEMIRCFFKILTPSLNVVVLTPLQGYPRWTRANTVFRGGNRARLRFPHGRASARLLRQPPRSRFPLPKNSEGLSGEQKSGLARTMTMSSADFLPLESVSALVHRGYVFFGIFLLSRSVFHISLDPMIDSLRGPRFAVRWAFCGKAPVFRRENVFQTQFCAVVSIN